MEVPLYHCIIRYILELSRSFHILPNEYLLRGLINLSSYRRDVCTDCTRILFVRQVIKLSSHQLLSASNGGGLFGKLT